jgi:DNA-binding transcriptional LysR family regulator
MELRDLTYFQVIAETGHLGRAAQHLGRTQPALTKCLRRLESALGARLFERVGRGLRLTSVGEVLLIRARQLRNSMDTTVREVSDFARGDAGCVRIGAAATATEYLLPMVCQQILREAPKVTLDLVIGMNDVLRNGLRRGELDLVLGPLPEVESTEFASVPAISDEVVVVARAGHALAGRSVKLRDLLGHKWVLPARTVATRQWLDNAFTSRGLPAPSVQIETTSISMLPRTIAATDLLSFISRRNLGVGRVGSPLQEIPLKETTMSRWMGVLFKVDGSLSPAAKRIIDLAGSGSPDGEAYSLRERRASPRKAKKANTSAMKRGAKAK